MVQFDEYDMLLEMLNHPYSGKHSNFLKYNESVAIRLAEELEIDIAGKYELVLCNDNVNDMIHVVLALYEVCQMDNEEAMCRMNEAHQTGGAVLLSKSFCELLIVKKQLEDRNLTCVITKE